MNRRFVIGVDLDDVLADFTKVYLALAYKRFGRPAPGTLPVDWEWSNTLPDPKEQELVWRDTDGIFNFWETLPVEDGVSASYVQMLYAEHEMYFPTARRIAGPGSPPTWLQSTRWIKRMFGIAFPRVIVSYEKGPLAAALKYDYFIDDRPKNCLDILKAVPNCKVYLKDSSHNQTFHDSRITRVKDFDTFAQIVNEAAKGE